ncbi:hypothetical protein ElyMa_006799300 [Elysia marginata]|uniref:Uncharacterized protein n=1 Tax=Elysia marginata TaxID=1093978 RepID=A0AAV4J7I2_9GAST|nr:hypothetical protein ElyMa_006799300 [Elysia marginata]
MRCPSGSAQPRLNYICDAKYKAAIDTFRKRVNKNGNGFEHGIDSLEPSIAPKGTALFEYKGQPSVKNLSIDRKARNSTKIVSQKCADDFCVLSMLLHSS